ncbi:MAG: peptidoglycan-binding domain-containing protein [Casimicrobiaceae bacterium]
MHTKPRLRMALIASAVSLALGAPLAYAADNTSTQTSPSPQTSDRNSQGSMTGKQKATAIGAGSGAVAGAVVGGPVGALVGAGIGGYVGHQGTDANGRVSTTSTRSGDGTVKKAQAALNDKGYSVTIDGRNGPNTQSAVRAFQEKNGLTSSGTLDDSTLNALGVKS